MDPALSLIRGKPITRQNWLCQTHYRCLSSAGQSISDAALLPPQPPPLNSSCSLWMWNRNCLSLLPPYPLPLLCKHPSPFKTQLSYVSIIPQFKKKKDSVQSVAGYLKLVSCCFLNSLILPLCPADFYLSTWNALMHNLFIHLPFLTRMILITTHRSGRGGEEFKQNAVIALHK